VRKLTDAMSDGRHGDVRGSGERRRGRSAGIGEEDGDLLGQGAELLGVGAHAVDVVVVLAAPFPGGGLALDGGQVFACEADLFAGDAGVRAAAVVLLAADDAVIFRAAADGAVIVQRPGVGGWGDAETLGHFGQHLARENVTGVTGC
jgi:hypothetical protein